MTTHRSGQDVRVRGRRRRPEPRRRVPELVFGTYGASRALGSADRALGPGKRLFDIRLRQQGSDRNGIGIAAAPSIGDLTGDGRLEIVVSTFDHGIDVFRVPRSDTKRMPWPTGRGNLLRNGAGATTSVK